MAREDNYDLQPHRTGSNCMIKHCWEMFIDTITAKNHHLDNSWMENYITYRLIKHYWYGQGLEGIPKVSVLIEVDCGCFVSYVMISSV